MKEIHFKLAQIKKRNWLAHVRQSPLVWPSVSRIQAMISKELFLFLSLSVVLSVTLGSFVHDGFVLRHTFLLWLHDVYQQIKALPLKLSFNKTSKFEFTRTGMFRFGRHLRVSRSGRFPRGNLYPKNGKGCQAGKNNEYPLPWERGSLPPS